MPFNALELSPDGTCQVCCKIEKEIKKPDGTKFNLVRDQLDDVWNSEDINLLRQKFLNGEEPIECHKCWVEESTGNFSLRQQTLNTSVNIQNPTPSYVSLKLSNKCNLACRICGPHLSSLWEQQYKKNNMDLGDKEYFLHVKDDKLTSGNNSTFRRWAPGFKHVLLYGGEPLINQEVLEFLDFCVDTHIAKNIDLVLNTNGTICNDTIISKLNQFKRVALYLSIDDIGERFEYQRWPARWDKISENIRKFCSLNSPFDVKFYPTFSILNTLQLKEILDGLSQFKVPINLTNIIHAPAHLALRSASPALKEQMIKSIEAIDFSRYQLDGEMDYSSIFIKNILIPTPEEFPTQKDWYITFRRILDQSDSIRGQNFKSFFPEMHKILELEFAE